MHTFQALVPSYNMPFDKLYVNVRCDTCINGRLKHAGHHNPYNPDEWKSCPYCVNGTRLIEAGTVAVVEFLKQLPTRRRNDILRQFNDDKDV